MWKHGFLIKRHYVELFQIQSLISWKPADELKLMLIRFIAGSIPTLHLSNYGISAHTTYYQLTKNGAYSRNTFNCAKSSIKKILEQGRSKVFTTGQARCNPWHYVSNAWAANKFQCSLCFFYLLYRNITSWTNPIITLLFITWNGILSVHVHAYSYPLFKSGTETGSWAIVLCRKDIVLSCRYRTTVKWNFLSMVIDVLLSMAR